MKVKKYKAKTMPEAMQLIKKDLGPDAVILQSKEIKKGGIFGLFKNKNIEVIAALDQMPVTPFKQSTPAQPFTNETKINRIDDENVRVLDEIKHLRQLIQEQAFTSEKNLSPVYESTYQYLLKQEVKEKIALDIVHSISDETKNDMITKKEMKKQLERKIVHQLQLIPFEKPIINNKIIQFVGPTGVGKTTTLAKVAAQTILQHKKKVAFITMDTYRIAAIEQLKTYAKILDVPIEVAYSIDDYRKALRQFNHYDVIFIDTAGRNFREVQYVRELKKMIEIEKMDVETHLVLSLTAKAKDTSDIFEQFKDLDIEKVIFTKMDETLTYGSILNICLTEKIPIFYFTNGQNVPDDVLEPSPELITELLLSRYGNE